MNKGQKRVCWDITVSGVDPSTAAHIHIGFVGQAFAGFDVLLPHPRKPAWVIEAVTAWGRVGALKSELRLLPALES